MARRLATRTVVASMEALVQADPAQVGRLPTARRPTRTVTRSTIRMAGRQSIRTVAANPAVDSRVAPIRAVLPLVQAACRLVVPMARRRRAVRSPGGRTVPSLVVLVQTMARHHRLTAQDRSSRLAAARIHRRCLASLVQPA